MLMLTAKGDHDGTQVALRSIVRRVFLLGVSALSVNACAGRAETSHVTMAESLDASAGSGGASAGGGGGGTSASGGGGSGGGPDVTAPGRGPTGGCGGAINLCSFVISLRADLGTTWEDVNSYSVRACRNDSCTNAELDSLLSAPAPGSAQSLSVSPPLMDVVTVGVENDAGAFILSGRWSFSEPSTLVNGDAYLMQVADAAGSSVVTVRKRAGCQTWNTSNACGGGYGLCNDITLVDAPEEDAGTNMLPADAMPPADAMRPEDAMPPADATPD